MDHRPADPPRRPGHGRCPGCDVTHPTRTAGAPLRGRRPGGGPGGAGYRRGRAGPLRRGDGCRLRRGGCRRSGGRRDDPASHRPHGPPGLRLRRRVGHRADQAAFGSTGSHSIRTRTGDGPDHGPAMGTHLRATRRGPLVRPCRRCPPGRPRCAEGEGHRQPRRRPSLPWTGRIRR